MNLLRYVLVAGTRVHSSTSKEMTMTPTEWLILTITTSVVVIVFGVWFYRLTH
jgi:hypothetical protein